MMSLFDQEKAVEQFGYEKRQEGCEEGREEGRIRQAKKTAVNMRKRGSSLDEIAEILELPADTIRTWVKEADALTEENPQILIKITDLTLISSGGSNYYKTFFRGRGVKLFSWKIEAINYNGRKEYEALGTPRHVSLLGVMSRSCYMGKFRNQIEYHKISVNEPVQSKSPLALRLADQAQCRYEK